MPGRAEFLECIRDLPPEEQKRLCNERANEHEDVPGTFFGGLIVFGLVLVVVMALVHGCQGC